jgi:hypothetical protein
MSSLPWGDNRMDKQQEDEQTFWLTFRQGLLILIAAIERFKVHVEPSTSDLRKKHREELIRRGDAGDS